MSIGVTTLQSFSEVSSEGLVREAHEILDNTEWKPSKVFPCEGMADIQTSVGQFNSVKWHMRLTEAEDKNSELYDWLKTVLAGSFEPQHYESDNHTLHEKQYIAEVKDIDLKFTYELQNTFHKSITYLARVYYSFSFPVLNRVFYELVHVVDETDQFLIIQVPVEPTQFFDPVRLVRDRDYIVGKYSSVEAVTKGDVLSWRMATASQPGGMIPKWITQFSMDKVIAHDCTAILDYVKEKKSKEAKNLLITIWHFRDRQVQKHHPGQHLAAYKHPTLLSPLYVNSKTTRGWAPLKRFSWCVTFVELFKPRLLQFSTFCFLPPTMSTIRRHSKSQSAYAFDNTTTSIAASQMRNHLNKLADQIPEGPLKKKFESEMDSFFALFRRYLTDKAAGTTLDWDKIKSPKPEEVVSYKSLSPPAVDNKELLAKLAVLKLNGGLGTSMGCIGPKSVIEVRDGNTFLDLSVRQIEHLNRKYDADVPLLLMNSFNTNNDTQHIVKKYAGHRIKIRTFNQSRFPRVFKDSLLPVPSSIDSPLNAWYPPGHGDLFESLTATGKLDELLAEGKEILFVSNGDNLGATVDLNILNHMLETGAEYIMELADKTRADVKGGTLINYDGQVRLLEVAQVPKEHVEEFKSIKKFKNFNTNNLWINLKAIKRLIEQSKIEVEIIPNQKTISYGGQSDVPVLQLETAVGAAIRFFDKAHGVVVPRSRFLPVKTCSDLLLVKSDLFFLEHGALKLDPNRYDGNPLIKLGSNFKKVSDFSARIPHMPKILELDHLTITGNVFLGKGVTFKGTVIIVCSDGEVIDIPNGSILENVVITGNLKILEH